MEYEGITELFYIKQQCMSFLQSEDEFYEFIFDKKMAKAFLDELNKIEEDLTKLKAKEKNIGMKKYIRTEEGIFEVLDKETDICVLTNKAWMYKKDIIAEADTPEKLCDEFIFINKVGKFDKSYVIPYNIPDRVFTEPTTAEKIAYIKKYYHSVLNQIKGAIYTDKGLIYVTVKLSWMES